MTTNTAPQTRAKTWTFRDLIAENGTVLRADYEFYREHNTFDAPSPGGKNAILRLLFRSETLKGKLMSVMASRIVEGRERRLAAHLESGGRLGTGKEIGRGRANVFFTSFDAVMARRERRRKV